MTDKLLVGGQAPVYCMMLNVTPTVTVLTVISVIGVVNLVSSENSVAVITV